MRSDHAHGLNLSRLSGRGCRVRATAAAALLVGGVLWVSQIIAAADFFGGRYADDTTHHFVSIESNNADFEELDGKFTAAMQHLDATTQMRDVKRNRHDYVSWVDAYWYATDQSNFSNPTVNGDTTCMAALASNRCDRFRVRFNEDRLWRSNRRIRRTACHEILHTVGFDDGWTGNSGCLPGWGTGPGFSDDIYMNTHEKNHINNHSY